ncbi:protein TASOR-like [Solea solea]|uniref:protein TASOR-like n=1 Tax=Solea solea TaxID=90069 RepID=UPI00272C87D7|nr:protein TASOR-like [Solea solea]
MESGNVDASLKGVLLPVRDTSDIFENSIVAPIQSAYLYEESRQSFRYKSAVLIENALLEEKYNAFRAKRRQEGYSEEDLKESYGFLLFDDVNKAHALGRNGVLTGNSTCTTLGDPLKGVYISMYSDCLDLNRWYNGKSGYIVIFRLTKGRVKRVFENYTQNLTPPTLGYDCHVSEELPSVSAKTSSFLAFERTQYYMYELLDDGSCETAKSPSAACPFAIVSFSYTDTKATLHAPHEISEEKKLDFHYVAWMGQLQIGTQFIDVGLRSAAVALIPIKLPPVVKIDRAIYMLELLQLLPRAAFETCLSGEVFLDGFYLSLCELVPSETEENKSFSLLLQEIKEKNLALPVPLNDGGFLMLLHSSHFLMYNGSGSKATEVMQAMFVFPDSRYIHKGNHSMDSLIY